jgi:hypothetical protein
MVDRADAIGAPSCAGSSAIFKSFGLLERLWYACPTNSLAREAPDDPQPSVYPGCLILLQRAL